MHELKARLAFSTKYARNGRWRDAKLLRESEGPHLFAGQILGKPHAALLPYGKRGVKGLAKIFCQSAMERGQKVRHIPEMSRGMRLARIAAKKTLEQVSGATGISVSQLSRYESGKKFARLDELKNIANFLRVKVTTLVDEDQGLPALQPLARAHEGNPIDIGRLILLLEKAKLLLEGQSLPDEEIFVLLEALIEDSRTPPDASLSASPDDQMTLRASAIIRNETRKPR